MYITRMSCWTEFTKRAYKVSAPKMEVKVMQHVGTVPANPNSGCAAAIDNDISTIFLVLGL